MSREFLDKFCIIDTETTGVIPQHNDVIEIAVLAVDEFLNLEDKFFHTMMLPSRPDNIDEEAIKTQESNDGKKLTLKKWKEILRHGLTPTKAADLLADWFESLRLPPKGRIIPIAHNWPFDREFIKDWLGQKTFEYLFAHSYIDTFPICKFIETVKLSRGEKSPFGISMRLKDISKDLGYIPQRSHNALDDCVTTSNIISLLKQFIGRDI